MKNYQAVLILLSAVGLAACGDKGSAVQVDEISAPVEDKALVRFVNFGVNAPGVNFFANDAKLTGFLATTGIESTSGTAYGGFGNSATGLYNAVAPGQYTLSGKIAATVDKDVNIGGVTATLVGGKRYSVYLSGLYNTTEKKSEAFIVEDDLPPIDFGRTCVRFVNAIFNSQPMALYVKDAISGVETKIGGEVAYKTAGAFVCFPGGSYDLSTRTAGSATNAISRTAVGFTNGKVYTIGARGDMTVVSTTLTNRPVLDNTANR